MAKRFLDLMAAALGLAILVVPLAAVAIAIKLETPGPLFFSQLRVGQFVRPFRMFKLRTMMHRPDAEAGVTLSGIRITMIGRFLRKSKFDELPQLINVLLGHMSWWDHDQRFLNSSRSISARFRNCPVSTARAY